MMKSKWARFASVFGVMMAAGSAASAQEMNFYRFYEGSARISGSHVKVELKINDRVISDDNRQDSVDPASAQYFDVSVREGELLCKGKRLVLGTGEVELCSGLKLVISNPEEILKGSPVSGANASLKGVISSPEKPDALSEVILVHTADQAGDHEGGIDD
ncbi:MAG: hypothetical protein EBX52_02275 [Proteobacteria bacterium]|nr:hypothetical protein [Pseudomonadota bacterium]